MADKKYIEREIAIECAKAHYPKADEMIAGIICLPAADVVKMRHGQWLTKEYMYGDPDVGIEDMWIDRLAEQSDYYAYCSICDKNAEYNAEGSLILSDYCPHCGARMDGETE